MAASAATVTSAKAVSKYGEHLAGKDHRALVPALLDRAAEERHEGDAEGAFGDEVAEEIGEAEGDHEGIGHGPRT